MISAKYHSRPLLRTAGSSIFGAPFERTASGDPFSAVKADLASSKAAGLRSASIMRSSWLSVALIESLRTPKAKGRFRNLPEVLVAPHESPQPGVFELLLPP